MMRLLAAAAAVMLFAAAAQAQTPLTGTTGQPTSGPPAAMTAPAHHGRTLQERFDEANTTKDGHLTAEQARAKMPSVSRDYADIDTDHKGYVTVDQIREHSRAKRAAARAAKVAAKAQ